MWAAPGTSRHARAGVGIAQAAIARGRIAQPPHAPRRPRARRGADGLLPAPPHRRRTVRAKPACARDLRYRLRSPACARGPPRRAEPRLFGRATAGALPPPSRARAGAAGRAVGQPVAERSGHHARRRSAASASRATRREPASGCRRTKRSSPKTTSRPSACGSCAAAAFTAGDRVEGSKATLINETMAKRFFAGQDPIGKRWATTRTRVRTPDAFVIVGVVEDAKYRDLQCGGSDDDLSPVGSDRRTRSSATSRCGRPARRKRSSRRLRQVLAEAEPALPVFDILPIEQRVARALSQDAVVARLTSVFSAISLLLACLGLYGTISYGVNQRVAELGLRIALGADRRQVLWLVMREALVLVAIGSAVGFSLAYLAGAQSWQRALRHWPDRSAGLRRRRGTAAERRPDRGISSCVSRVTHRAHARDGGDVESRFRLSSSANYGPAAKPFCSAGTVDAPLLPVGR